MDLSKLDAAIAAAVAPKAYAAAWSKPDIPNSWTFDGVGGALAKVWEYRSERGEFIAFAARYDNADGRKVGVIPWTYDGSNWIGKIADKSLPRPIYGLDLIAKYPDLPVLIVEGEKCADAATALLAGYVCISWLGGSGVADKVDWGPLEGRSVTIWPDADEPGAKAADAIVEALRGCRVLDVADRPDKWDIADAVAEGWDAAKLTAFIAEREVWRGADAVSDGWADPDDLVQVGAGDSFPVEALPPVMLAAVREVQAYVQAPVAMVAGAALGALSIAAQGLLDVDRDSITTGPCSLFLLTIAESGERKSSCDSYFGRVISDWERDRAAALAPAVSEAEDRLAAWGAERAGLLDAIKAAGKKGNPTADLKTRLVAMDASKPKLVQVPMLRFADVTTEALGNRLVERWPSAGIVSSEAGIVFGSHSMRAEKLQSNLGLLNCLWDGGSKPVDRVGKGSYVVGNARLTMALATQEASLREFNDDGGLARGMGFFARFLIAWPETTQGGRAYCEATPMPAVDRLSRRVRELLDTPLPLDSAGRLVPVRVGLDTDAKAVWVAYHDMQEARLGGAGDLSDVRDVASKTADNAARLAGLIHALAWGNEGTVSADSMARACTLAAWYLGQSQRLFAGLGLDPGMKAAVALDSWLVARCNSEGVLSVPTAAVGRLGPYSVRSKDGWTAALAVLERHNRARLLKHGNRPMIAVNPALLKKS